MLVVFFSFIINIVYFKQFFFGKLEEKFKKKKIKKKDKHMIRK